MAGLIACDPHDWQASAFFFAVALFALLMLWVLNKIEGK